MPLRAEFETSFARVGHREVLVVVLRAAGGIVGFGEAPVAARPHYSEETTVTARHALKDFLAPAVVGKDLPDLTAFFAAFAWVRGHRMARAALEAAFRDAFAKTEGVSLAAMLGAKRDTIPAGVSLGIPAGADPHALLTEVERFVARGYRRVKVKIRPGFARRPLELIRGRFPELALAADANGAFTLADHAALSELDPLRLVFLEQPLHPDDLVDHARLARALETPICLDESLKTPFDVEAALALRSTGVVNLKPARVGGIGAALAIHDLCRRGDVPLWCGGMLETGIGRAANVALAALPGFTMPGDLSASDRYYEEDLVEPPFRLLPGGELAVPRGPGIGVEVVAERLERATVAREEIRA
jgi:O-succinylbenzoate synthase